MESHELAALRQHFGYTPTQAAAIAGVSAQTWTRWETGKTAMNILAVKRFAIVAKHDAEILSRPTAGSPEAKQVAVVPAKPIPATAKVNTATMSDVDRMLYEGGLRR